MQAFHLSTKPKYVSFPEPVMTLHFTFLIQLELEKELFVVLFSQNVWAFARFLLLRPSKGDPFISMSSYSPCLHICPQANIAQKM